jgi:hypothetical protein
LENFLLSPSKALISFSASLGSFGINERKREKWGEKGEEKGLLATALFARLTGLSYENLIYLFFCAIRSKNEDLRGLLVAQGGFKFA